MTNQGHIPSRIVAGETIWIADANTIQSRSDIVLDDFAPSDGSSLAYKFAATTPATVAAVANGDNTGWTLEVPAATTLTWKPTRIAFVGHITLSGRVYTVDQGALDVDPSPLATSDWTAVVTACDAAILKFAASPRGSFAIGDMTVSYRSLSQLTDLRSYAKTMEQAETGQRQKRIIRTRFNLI
jgi:hypothetical protein